MRKSTWTLTIGLVFLVACTTPLKRSAKSSQQGEAAAPPVEPNRPGARREAPEVALVLGPGGAKALAHVGVIKALQENRIPIGRIVGVEWGALIAAAYGLHGQSHDAEWKLYKLDQIDLSGKGSFLGLGHSERTVRMLDGYLKDNFGSSDIASMKVPFACPSRSFWTGAVFWQQKGPIVEAVRKCLPFPPLFQLQGNWLAAPTRAKDAIDQLKAEGYKVIIVVDVLGSGSPFPKEKLLDDPSNVILWQDLQHAMLEAETSATEFIRVPTEGYFVDQFDHRKELVQVGEQEGVRAAQRLSAKYGY